MSTENRRGKIKSHFGLPYIPWNKLNFLRLQEKNQNVAKCLFCSKVLKNVGYNRLLGEVRFVLCWRDRERASQSVKSRIHVIYIM